MIPLDKYPHIPHGFTLRQAMVEIEKSEFNIKGRKSLPRVILILDEKYQLMGMVRRRDILRGLEPRFLRGASMDYQKKLFDIKVDGNLSEINYDHFVNGIKERAERPVREVMRPITSTVDHNDHIIKVIYEMVDNDLSLLPVLKEGKVVGVVRSVDVFHEVANLLL